MCSSRSAPSSPSRALQAEFVTKTGVAADVIAALADKGKYDLLMMGSHGHGTLGNLVLGSVATKVHGAVRARRCCWSLTRAPAHPSVQVARSTAASCSLL